MHHTPTQYKISPSYYLFAYSLKNVFSSLSSYSSKWVGEGRILNGLQKGEVMLVADEWVLDYAEFVSLSLNTSCLGKDEEGS